MSASESQTLKHADFPALGKPSQFSKAPGGAWSAAPLAFRLKAEAAAMYADDKQENHNAQLVDTFRVLKVPPVRSKTRNPSAYSVLIAARANSAKTIPVHAEVKQRSKIDEDLLAEGVTKKTRSADDRVQAIDNVEEEEEEEAYENGSEEEKDETTLVESPNVLPNHAEEAVTKSSRRIRKAMAWRAARKASKDAFKERRTQRRRLLLDREDQHEKLENCTIEQEEDCDAETDEREEEIIKKIRAARKSMALRAAAKTSRRVFQKRKPRRLQGECRRGFKKFLTKTKAIRVVEAIVADETQRKYKKCFTKAKARALVEMIAAGQIKEKTSSEPHQGRCLAHCVWVFQNVLSETQEKFHDEAPLPNPIDEGEAETAFSLKRKLRSGIASKAGKRESKRATHLKAAPFVLVLQVPNTTHAQPHQRYEAVRYIFRAASNANSEQHVTTKRQKGERKSAEAAAVDTESPFDTEGCPNTASPSEYAEQCAEIEISTEPRRFRSEAVFGAPPRHTPAEEDVTSDELAGEESAINEAWMKDVRVPVIYRKLAYMIADTAQRGICLGQLEDLGGFVQTVVGKSKIADREGKEQSWETVNMYVINDCFIKVLTKEHQCSFVELLAHAEQVPSWFISHYWGTPFRVTLRMLGLHHRQRGLARNDFYWLCTLANNQHKLEELSGPLEDTPFVRVLRSTACKGTVALMDRAATPFTRIWCVLEVHETLTIQETRDQEGFPYDIAAWVSAETQYLGGDPIPEQATIQLDATFDATAREATEFGDDDAASFPWSVARCGAKTDVRSAAASRQDDKTNILRYIGSNADKVNAKVRERFATAAAKGAIIDGDVAALRDLVRSYPACTDTVVEQGGDTLCHTAATLGHVNALRALVGARADVDKAREDGVTPCYVAAQEGRVGALRALLDARADVDKAEESGATPCFMAAQGGHADALRVLIDARADVDKTREDGVTPCFMAAAKGHADALIALVNAGADVDKATEDGVTPCLQAAQGGHVGALRALIGARADTSKSWQGRTPLGLAEKRGHTEAAALLRSCFGAQR